MNGSTNTSNLSTDSVSVNVHAAFRGGWHIPRPATFTAPLQLLWFPNDALRGPPLWRKVIYNTNQVLSWGWGVREVPVHRSSGGEKPERSSLTPTRFQPVKGRVWKQIYSCSVQKTSEHSAMFWVHLSLSYSPAFPNDRAPNMNSIPGNSLPTFS